MDVDAGPRRIAVLGATGSIGTSALDVVARHPGRLRATVLAAGSRVDALVALCRAHRPLHAVIGDEALYQAKTGGRNRYVIRIVEPEPRSGSDTPAA